MARYLLIVAMLIAVLASSASSDKAAENLLTNGGFEKSAAGQPAGWTFGASGGEKIDIGLSEDRPREGKQCLYLKGNATWAAAFISPPGIAIDRGKAYTLSGYMRVARGQAAIKFDYFQNETHLGQSLPAPIGPTDGWKQMTVQSELPLYPTATHLVTTVAGMGDMEVWFDDVALTAK